MYKSLNIMLNFNNIYIYFLLLLLFIIYKFIYIYIFLFVLNSEPLNTFINRKKKK